MTRDEFLQFHWPPYPVFHLTSGESERWVCGKVASVNGAEVKLMGSEQVLLCHSEGDKHPQLGPCLPISLLYGGDSVAFRAVGEKWQGPFLLSPNLLSTGAVTTKKEWQTFLEEVRKFFIEKGFQHWVTPYLVVSSGVDAHIDFMTVEGVRTGKKYALPTSPEFALKKAIAAGEQKVFEIKACFRDDDPSPIHRQEFTMIEWYRAYANKWSLVDDFEALLSHLAPGFGWPAGLKLLRVSFPQLFFDKLGFELKPDTPVEELRLLIEEKGLHWTLSDDWDDLFFRLYIEFIEPQLGQDQPVAVFDFPATQGSLSRKSEAGWADRFEIYWQGVELANAYQEQNNPELVSEVVTQEIRKRKGLGRVPPEVDEDFLNAMRAGFPPSAWIAMGLDRLFMVLQKTTSLS